MSSVEDRIEKALINYLLKVHEIEAVTASFDSTTEGDADGGCDTCGYGRQEMFFTINYMGEFDSYHSYITVDGDPLDFLPTLYQYDES